MISTSDLQKNITSLVAGWKQQANLHDAEIPKWILPPRSCQFLQAACKVLPTPVSAFEFGSGCSTHALRVTCESVFSVEDSSEWLAKTEIAEAAIPKRPSDFTAVVPLTKCWNQFRLIESFNIASHPQLLAALQKANLILIDSPPNPAKREHALFQALRHASEGTLIVVDDLNVGAARRFCERLAKQNPNKLAFWLIELDHDLGIFFKLTNGSISSRPTLREIIGAWMRL